jgi:hypothetical protein
MTFDMLHVYEDFQCTKLAAFNVLQLHEDFRCTNWQLSICLNSEGFQCAKQVAFELNALTKQGLPVTTGSG